MERQHDGVLATAVREAAGGRSRLVVLVGTSSTGKTRACWQALQPLAETRWRLWHPFDPTRAEAALEELHQVGPHTVVWLNEAQHYFGDRVSGERIAAAVHRLLIYEERGPVLVLGTLWPEYADRYTSLPAPGGEGPHTRVRELLAGRTVAVPDAFDTAALAAATVLAERGDALLADALTRARDGGRVTQDLAGAPELLRRYEQATPPARALLHAAMDARRFGVSVHLSQTFLTDAASDYLSSDDYDQLTNDWAEQAYAELAKPGHGKQAPLHRVRPRPSLRPPSPPQSADHPPLRPTGPMFRLADYLEQHGRTTRRHLCPPTSFWHSADTHVTNPDDLRNLADEARQRRRDQWAHHLRKRAADHGDSEALRLQVGTLEGDGQQGAAENLARQAAQRGNAAVLTHLAWIRSRDSRLSESAKRLYREAADYGHSQALLKLASILEAEDREAAEAVYREAAERSVLALHGLARLREEAGDLDAAEAHLQKAADQGDAEALFSLVKMRDEGGDPEAAETLALKAARQGHNMASDHLIKAREQAGDRDGAEDLARRANDHGNPRAIVRLARMREDAGDPSADALLQHAADQGNTDALCELALKRDAAGDQQAAERLAQQAADHGATEVQALLAFWRAQAGDYKGAETLARQSLACGSTLAVCLVADSRSMEGDREAAEALYQQAADRGDADALMALAKMCEKDGDRQESERLARQAAHQGKPEALLQLAWMRNERGDRQAAEDLGRQAADYGLLPPERRSVAYDWYSTLWPDGLDPDGNMTPPRQ
ncbi:tetratricopeptide repeat protein [Streptomyces chartreusis]|uniref:tetratricopeptide repeat protein n=1 Tax=Streptomyces chartreusis TaxID=1969 RepID=UPI00362B27F9